jgi:hypothetical protein
MASLMVVSLGVGSVLARTVTPPLRVESETS